MPQTVLISDKAELDKIITDQDIEILSELEVGDEGLQLSYRYKDESHASAGMTSYQLVSFVTSYARCMLYRLMDSIEADGREGRVLYFDTDSCIFVEKEGESLVETGNTLGSLTDEVLADTGDPGAYIIRAGFTSPKSYYLVYKLSNGEEIFRLKAKGITMHTAAAEEVNEDSLTKLFIEYPNIKPILVPQNVIYSTASSTLLTKVGKKVLRIVTGKRVMDEDGRGSKPFGYKRSKIDCLH